MNEHAVVIGASMAGLLAARALADTYERVTIVERDELPAGAEQRRAIPQGRHVHALLPRGQQELEMLLPGITAELIDAGAVTYEALSEMYFSVQRPSRWRAVAMNRDTLLASRPLIEAHVRRRVGALPGRGDPRPAATSPAWSLRPAASPACASSRGPTGAPRRSWPPTSW